MTKSKLYGIKSRRLNALDRLAEAFRITEVALNAANDIQSKQIVIKQKRMKKEITNLEAKKNFSRKNK